VPERGAEPLGVAHLLEEAWQPGGDVPEGLVTVQVYLLVLERPHEALRLGVVVRAAAPV
jgi:hypothetical protein